MCIYFIQCNLVLQNCFKPVETLQELEQLTSEVLLPLFSHHVVQSLIKNLRYVGFTSCQLCCQIRQLMLE